MALTTICATVVVWIVVGNIPVSHFGVMPRVLVLVLLVLFVIASLAVTEVIPWRSRSWADWRRPKVLSNVVYLLLAAAAFIAGISSIFNEPTAKQETAQATLDLATAVGREVGIRRPSRIRQHIERIWGEEGCDVTYRLSLNDRALTMVSLKSPGIADARFDYTINEDSDRIGRNGERLSVMETREERGWFPGYGTTFTYGSNGTSETLRWQPRKPGVNSVVFVPC